MNRTLRFFLLTLSFAPLHASEAPKQETKTKSAESKIDIEALKKSPDILMELYPTSPKNALDRKSRKDFAYKIRIHLCDSRPIKPPWGICWTKEYVSFWTYETERRSRLGLLGNNEWDVSEGYVYQPTHLRMWYDNEKCTYIEGSPPLVKPSENNECIVYTLSPSKKYLAFTPKDSKHETIEIWQKNEKENTWGKALSIARPMEYHISSLHWFNQQLHALCWCKDQDWNMIEMVLCSWPVKDSQQTDAGSSTTTTT